MLSVVVLNLHLLCVQLFNSRTCQLVLGAGAMQVGCCRPFTESMSMCPAAAGAACTAVPLFSGKPTSSPISGQPSARKVPTLLTALQVSGLKSITAKHLALSCPVPQRVDHTAPSAQPGSDGPCTAATAGPASARI